MTISGAFSCIIFSMVELAFFLAGALIGFGSILVGLLLLNKF